MSAIIASILSHLITAIGAAIIAWIGAKLHTISQKNAAEKDTKKAVDDASQNNDTSGLFK